jgi:hypothetical protein
VKSQTAGVAGFFPSAFFGGRSIAAVIFSVALFAVFYCFPPFPQVRLSLALVVLSLPVALALVISNLVASLRRRRLESGLPAALSMAAAFSADSIGEIPSAIASCGMGEAGKAFLAVARLFESGYSFDASLKKVCRSAGSPLFSLASAFLSSAYANGFEARAALSRISANISEILELRTDLSNSLMVPKFTILASAGFFVPFIVSLLLGIVGRQPGAPASLLGAATAAVQAYVVIFAIIAGLFVGMVESDLWRGLAFSAICAPLALAIFAAGMG